MSSSERSSGKTPADGSAPAGYLAGACLAANAMPGMAFCVPGSAAEVRAAVDLIARHDWCASLTGEPGARLFPSDAPEVHPDLPTLDLGGRRAGGEWWDGYADVLHAVARTLDLPAVPTRPDAAAVVGIPLDRLEPDRLADRDEVVRLLARGAGLDVVSVWPSGEGPDPLKCAAEARLIVSLPYGREAARTLAQRTRAALVEVGLPVGLAGTARFVREVARAAGRDPDLFLDREMRRYAPRLEWVIPHALLHRRVRVEGPPPLREAILAFLNEVGCRITDENAPDLVIGPRPAVEAAAAAGHAFLEVGFPSPGSHALHPTPSWLGFEGAMRLAEAMVNRLVQWEYVERFRRPARR